MKTTSKPSQLKDARPTQGTIRHAPLLRSAYWALLIGAVAGCLFGIVQIYALQGELFWSALGGVGGVLLGAVAGCDLLIPGPGPADMFDRERGPRVGPFRWGVLLLLLMVEGLIIGGYLWGSVNLTCQHLGSAQTGSAQIDCLRTVDGWFGTRQTGETRYEDVVGVSLSVHDELLLQHGPFAQSQVAAGFGEAELATVQQFLTGLTPSLLLVAQDWRIRLGAPVCFGLALLCAVWAAFCLRQGLALLREQFEQNEIYWGWFRPI